MAPVSRTRAFCHLQEFTSGGKLFIGGLEAAQAAASGHLPFLDLMVECRGSVSQGYDRNKQPHRLPEPSAVAKVFHPATKLTERKEGTPWTPTQKQVKRMVKSLTPIMNCCALGDEVLVYCLNGANRSGQTGTFMVASCTGDWQLATNHVWRRRHLVDYTSLDGRRVHARSTAIPFGGRAPGG